MRRKFPAIFFAQFGIIAYICSGVCVDTYERQDILLLNSLPNCDLEGDFVSETKSTLELRLIARTSL